MDPQVEEALMSCLESEMKSRKLSWKSLAESVLHLSNHFQSEVAVQTLYKGDFDLAYLAYFFPLNFLRLSAALEESENFQFIKASDKILDFGSGPGTAHFALLSRKITFSDYSAFEISQTALRWHQELLEKLAFEKASKTHFLSSERDLTKAPAPDLYIFSYSLNELSQSLDWLSPTAKILILEPSTRQDGRRLMTLRKQFLAKGYRAIAPCTHQLSCPLLEDSKTDWCHHRIRIQTPQSVRELEKYLPMRNETLTYSYLLLEPSASQKTPLKNTRVIGDRLDEKGKTRQMICRGPEREFLSWLKKEGEAPQIPRGALISIPEEAEKRGNEIRIPR